MSTRSSPRCCAFRAERDAGSEPRYDFNRLKQSEHADRYAALVPYPREVHGAGLSLGRCLLRSFRRRGAPSRMTRTCSAASRSSTAYRFEATTSQLCDIIITRATNIREPTAIDMNADAASPDPAPIRCISPDSWVQPNDLARMEQFSRRGPLEAPRCAHHKILRLQCSRKYADDAPRPMVMNGSGLPGSPNKAADAESAIFGFIEKLASVSVTSLIKQFWSNPSLFGKQGS